ncbi:serine/threonine protein kinase ppk15, putative [Entamoeba invadens IP1]|uniref:Serine/threonine protein kinase ppk15, putative n=1 Tax=Entamoeba invadens IP1 TaxID=370355 RepID=A0A0A1U614_ENTIV|nr:serine/threonine protein kinase ppk15, putative [Entamoeba invadens IP1]ELP88320.1 serine/threonine protein kinase ppk15, putative [Entamoeba invadens IP1]|eukprot:XP_004255091.1 serine/threonine protein kinase ppk15, putative [Entamoeba invadens IP1]
MFIAVPYAPPQYTPSNSLCQLATIRLNEVLRSANQLLVLPNVRLALTNPSTPTHNNGLDNEGYDLITYADSSIGSAHSKEGNACAYIKDSSYRIISSLGKGTFGQVFKCENTKSHEIVAIKVLKNKPCYFRQGMLEIAMLNTVNLHNENNDKSIVRILDHFLYNRHVCVVFELLGLNLYDVLRINKNKGMGYSFAQTIGSQIPRALLELRREGVIHCDLKPENVLLVDNKTTIKVIDFGSSCFEGNTLYTYIQSRHYRAPEIILGLPYTCAIDMWSFGCIIAEMMIGIPIFPGESEYNQLVKIIEMVGMPSTKVLEMGSKTQKFFKRVQNSFTGEVSYVLYTPQEFCDLNGVKYIENKRYHRFRNLEELCVGVNMHRGGVKKSNDDANRRVLLDFLKKIFVMDPEQRMTPEEALVHPFMPSEIRTEYQNLSYQHFSSYEMKNSREDNSIGAVVQKMFQGTMSLQFLRNQNFSVEKYYQNYIKALDMGIVLNVLHINPFHFNPFRVGLETKRISEDVSEDLGLNADDELPPILPLNEMPLRSRSRSLGFFKMEEEPLGANEDELPSIGLTPSQQITRKMVMTPTRGGIGQLRPPTACPRSSFNSVLSSPKGNPRVITMF